MEKLDLKKLNSSLYKATAGKPTIINVPELNYLMADGYGDPNTSALFADTIEALFSLSYTLKFMVKKSELEVDYGVMPLEGLWWVDDITEFSTARKEDWKWTLMICQPEFITNEMIEIARKQLMTKKALSRLADIRLEKMTEGEAVQVLHIGSFSEEQPTVNLLHQFMSKNGYIFKGKHREIYLSDMRKTAPDKLKTIIRQPVEKAGDR